MTKAGERLDENGPTKLLAAGNPTGEVRTAWQAKEIVRSIYDHSRHVRDGQAVVSTGSGAQTIAGHTGGEDAVEGTARLEGAGML